MILYGAVMAGLLFLAFAFFTVAQAGSVRNGGQAAADAAALAAAREDRDGYVDGLLDAVADEDAADGGPEDDAGGAGPSWRDWLGGSAPLTGDGCGAADRFAARNRSDVTGCEPVTRHGAGGYAVRIRTRFDTGDTVVPGADHRRGRATATAVVRPLCAADDGIGGEGEGSEGVRLHCDGGDFTLGPRRGSGADGSNEPEPSDLFAVVLVD